LKTFDAVNLFIQSRQSKGLSTMTIKWYREILLKFAHNYRKLPGNPRQIEEFIGALQVGDERRHGYYRTLRAFYRWLKKIRKIKNNPLDIVEPPKRSVKIKSFLMPDQIDQLLSYPHIPVIKACLMFLVDTGCRISELLSVRLGNFTETPWGYLVKVKGKTGERLLPISPEVYKSIIPYIPLPFTPYRLRIKIVRAFKDAHIKGSSITLRHTFGTLWDGDEFALQRIMGHSSLTTTLLYRHLRTEFLSRQHNQYSPLKYVFAKTKVML